MQIKEKTTLDTAINRNDLNNQKENEYKSFNVNS